MRLDLVSPLLVVASGAVLTLVVGIFLPRRLQYWNAVLVVVTTLIAIGADVFLYGTYSFGFSGSFVEDTLTFWTQGVLLLGGALTALLAVPVFRNDAREGEFYTLLLLSLEGAMVLAGAADLMEIMLGILLSAVGSYALVGYRRTDPLAAEALLKYYLFGALTNIALMLGLVLVYGLTGTTALHALPELMAGHASVLGATALVLVVAGLGFKAGFVPAHFWMPDALHASTAPVAAFLSVVPKIAGFAVLARVLNAIPESALAWPGLLAFIAALTMSWGNLAAWRQENLQRMMAYSTISQSGYMLMAIVVLHHGPWVLASLLYYFLAYLVANFGAFAVIALLASPTIAGIAGLNRRRPLLALAMTLSLLSLMGLPPLAVFVGKFALFAAAIHGGYAWLAAMGAVNSVVSLYYYLRVIGPMYLQDGTADPAPDSAVVRWVALTCAFLTVALGLGAYLFYPLLHAPTLLG